MSGHLFFDAANPSGLPGSPLYTPGSYTSEFTSRAFAIEKVFNRLFCLQINPDTTYEHLTKWDIPIFSSFPLPYMHYLTVKVKVGDLQSA
jgi:hypothetical protein